MAQSLGQIYKDRCKENWSKKRKQPIKATIFLVLYKKTKNVFRATAPVFFFQQAINQAGCMQDYVSATILKTTVSVSAWNF